MSKEKNVKIFEITYQFLKDIKPEGVRIERYFECEKWNTLEEVYVRFIGSAQNYQQMPNVIGFYKNESRRTEFYKLLYSFNFREIAKIDVEDIYNIFRKQFNISNSESRRNCWHKWCCSVVDSAKFLSSFKDVNDFRAFVDSFNYNDNTRMALPLLIQARIRGIGFALACDLLKELGYMMYSKPDVHLRQVFHAIGLCEDNQYAVFETIGQMANDCKDKYPDITAYKVDKIFWLICSGNFYKEKIEIKSHKKELIERLQNVI